MLVVMQNMTVDNTVIKEIILNKFKFGLRHIIGLNTMESLTIDIEYDAKIREWMLDLRGFVLGNTISK